MKKIPVFVAILFSLIFFYSCKSAYQTLLKSNNSELKYKKAMEYFNNRDYNKAMTIFEQIMPVFKLTEKGEDVLYYYSQCNNKLGDNVTAGFYFRKFVTTYPDGKYTEECQFLSAYCYYLDSPKSSLDQESTNNALQEFETFVTKYPNISKIQECNKLMDELRNKLAEKSFNVARLYYRLGYYRAADIAFKTCLKDYPDSKFKEEATFMVVKSNYHYALNSVESKKEKRLETTLQEYSIFKRRYPQSKFIKDADDIYSGVNKELTKIKTNNKSLSYGL
jgi:outer membrane protein assembly factor BamD